MKHLIFEDKRLIDALQVSFNEQAARLDAVVNAFHSFQSFEKIDSSQKAFSLLEDPLAYFDRVLLDNAPFKTNAGAKLNPDAVGSLLSINRAGYISAIGSQSLKGERISYFVWDNGFKVAPKHFEAQKEMYRYYLESESEQALFNQVTELVSTLNKAIDSGLIASGYFSDINDISKRIANVKATGNLFEVDVLSLIEFYKKQRKFAA